MKYFKVLAFVLVLFTQHALAHSSSAWNKPLLEFASQSYLDGKVQLTSSQRKDVDCLAKAIFYEARGESYTGKKMVANVVLNRTRYGKPFANTICKVVYQPNQFSWTKETRKRNTDFRSVARAITSKNVEKETKSVKETVEIALYFVLFMPENTGKATHFSSKDDKFGRTLFVKQVGNHKFYEYLGNG